MHRIIAEDQPSSDSDRDLDLDLNNVGSTGDTDKGLNISHYIDMLTQTQSQDQEPEASDASLDTEDNEGNETESDGIGEDREAAYREFTNRKSLKRKRAAAETRKAKAARAALISSRTSIIGRKPGQDEIPTADWGKRFTDAEVFQHGPKDDEPIASTTEERIPDYIHSRRKKLRRLQAAGLRYPPCHDDIPFSESEKRSESDEKPVLVGVKPQRSFKDVALPISKGIIPAPIAQWLREYQIDGVNFLHQRFVEQRGALLGDDMGLGKTIQVIAFLTAAFGKSGTKRDAKLMRKVRRMEDGRWYPRILIVCPGTLMRNWEEELEKWGWWQIYVYHGPPAEREAALNAATQGRAEIMITTYTTYRNNQNVINTVDWDCVIADECHAIKSKSAEITKAMNRVNALCRIGLTGTALQNKYEELWTLLNWANPGQYGTAASWKHEVSTPLKVGQAHDATNEQLATARIKARELVENILPDVFLRRMKSLIADQLPKKSDRVVFCQLTETQAEAYQNLVDSDMFEYVRRAAEPCDCGSNKKRGWCHYMYIPSRGKWSNYPFPCMVTLQKLSNHLALILPLTADKQEKQEKDLDNLQVALPDQWKELYRIKDNILGQSQREFCGKWKVLKRLLDFWHSNGDKVLVFSHSVRLLRLLKTLFDVDGTKYNFSYLDGSMTYEDRAKAVADFNANPNQFVFLISTRAGGVGLNITSANKVVVVDPNWNPAYDLQAQDRAYRIGQTRDVEVFRLISSGTIEEIVYARQIYKQQQANIGYTASLERRYFKGVMDEKGKKGELFGLESLFTFQENGLLLRDIINKTNVAEVKAGVSAMDFDLDADMALDDDAEENSLLSDEALGLDDVSSQKQIRNIANMIVSGDQKRKPKWIGPDPINAILEKAGVLYTHENSEVIGKSKIEAELSRKAIEFRNDLDLGRKTAFDLSQSQGTFPESDVLDHSQTIPRSGNAIGEEFRISYKYRPDESIKQRQFCSIATMEGYDDPIEFALAVEEMTQEQRRIILDKFYKLRRRQLS
jgi:SNF2 family DNA or RNA helicase